MLDMLDVFMILALISNRCEEQTKSLSTEEQTESLSTEEQTKSLSTKKQTKSLSTILRQFFYL